MPMKQNFFNKSPYWADIWDISLDHWSNWEHRIPLSSFSLTVIICRSVFLVMCFAKSCQFCFSYFQLRMFKSILNQCAHQKFMKSLKESLGHKSHAAHLWHICISWFIYKNIMVSFNTKYNLHIQKKPKRCHCQSCSVPLKTCTLGVLPKCNNLPPDKSSNVATLKGSSTIFLGTTENNFHYLKKWI